MKVEKSEDSNYRSISFVYVGSKLLSMTIPFRVTNALDKVSRENLGLYEEERMPRQIFNS